MLRVPANQEDAVDIESASRCPSCGSDNRSRARFCRRCGNPLPERGLIDTDALVAPVRSEDSRPPPSLREWPELRSQLWMFGSLMGVSLLSGFAYRLEVARDAYIDLVTTLVSLEIICGFAYRHRRGLIPLLVPVRFEPRALAWALFAAAALGVIGSSYFWILSKFGFQEALYWSAYDEVGWPAWVGVVLVCVYPALFEEIAFRGVLLNGLDRLMTPNEALLVQAAAFSVLHLAPAIFVSHFGIGLLLGLLRRKTGALWAGIFLHGAWNGWVLADEAMGLWWWN